MESCYFIYKKQKKKILKKGIPALDATSYFLFSPVFTCADFLLIKLKKTLQIVNEMSIPASPQITLVCQRQLSFWAFQHLMSC